MTNHSKTRIDLLFTNRPERVTNTYNLLTRLSDHHVILFTRKLSRQRLLNFCPKSENSTPLYEFIPRSHFATALNSYNWAKVLSCQDTDHACDLLNRSVREVMAHFSTRQRRKRKKGNALPWVNEDCRRLMCTRDVFLQQSLKSGLNTDPQKFTSMRNKEAQTLRKAKANFFLKMKITERVHANRKLIWQNINK